MNKKEKFKTFIIIFILSGLYIFVFSESGILERRELKSKYDQLTEKIDHTKSSNLDLSKECEKYRSGVYNKSDIIGSGFVYKTGKFLYIKDIGKERADGEVISQDRFLISLEHMRVIWILISLMILCYHFLKNNKSDELTDGTNFN